MSDGKLSFRAGLEAARVFNDLPADMTTWEQKRAWGVSFIDPPLGNGGHSYHRGWDYAIICAREIAGHGEGAGR